MNIFKLFFSRIMGSVDPIDKARKAGVKIGMGCSFVTYPVFSEPYLVEIGDNVRVSSNCSFVCHDGGRFVLDNLYPSEGPFYKFGKIIIGNNVFIGMNTIILPNVSIGSNCIIGAGSIVTINVPTGEVWGGVPAKFICKVEDYHEKLLIHMKQFEINFSKYNVNKKQEIIRAYEK